MFSVFKPNMPLDRIPEFLIFAIWEHKKLSISKASELLPQTPRRDVIGALTDLRDLGLLSRDGNCLCLSEDGERLRKEKGLPDWYLHEDQDFTWYPDKEILKILNLQDSFSPIEISIINHFDTPFTTAEASDFIGFFSYQILCGLEQATLMSRA